MKLSEQIKVSLPIVDEFRCDGHELRRVGSQFVCLCPFHQERTPSCHVNPATGRFHCFGCGSDGTVIDYTALKRGITSTDAIAVLSERTRLCASVAAVESNGKSSSNAAGTSKGRRFPKLPLMRKGSPAELAELAKRRHLSVESVRLASSRGLLWFCRLNDGPEGVVSWVITDRTRRNAQARRLDGERWRYMWDAESKQWLPVEPDRQRKVRGFTGNQASWPVGIEEAQSFNSIALVEGGPDLLAAFHFGIAEGREATVAPVAMLGACNRVAGDVLNQFTGKYVRFFPHSDEAGLCAAATWATQLRQAVAGMDAFDFSGLIMTCGKPVKDLNDLVTVAADSFEREPDVQAVMTF